MRKEQLISGVEVYRPLEKTYQITTPINGTYAYTFGMKPKNVTAVCIPKSHARQQGLFSFRNALQGTNALFQLAYASLLTGGSNFIIKPICQVTVVGQIMGGIIGGPSFVGRFGSFSERVFPLSIIHLIETMSTFGVMFFLFLLGVKMDYGMIKNSGSRAWLIGISTFFFPLLLTLPCSLILKKYFEMDDELETSIGYLAILVSSRTFHGVARFLDDLKLLNSELGRLAMSSSMISGYLSYTTLIFIFSARQSQLNGDGFWVWACIITSGLAQIIFTKVAVKPILIWITKQTPEGQAVREFHHYIIFLLVLVSAFISEIIGMHSFFGPMILGLEVPDGSPLAFAIVDKLDFFVSFVLLPIYFLASGGRTNWDQVTPHTFLIVEIMSLLGFLSKLIGTVLPCFFLCGMLLRDSITLGLILNSVGILDIYFYSRANQLMCINNQCFSVLNTTGMLITGFASHLVSTRYDPSARYIAFRRRTIQHSSRKLELRLLVCVHQEEQVPNIINLLEVSNPTREGPIAVVLLHLTELAAHAASVLVAHEPSKHFDHCPTPIINAFRMYERNNLYIVTLQSFTAIAPYATMHDDICTLALDKRTSLVILPFHRHRNTDHGKDLSKFRSVNLKVLDKAPCSVGIIIDGGAWRGTRSVLGSWSFFRVGVFFIGGADDREAVAYAMRMSGHPSVTVTLVRLVPKEMSIDDQDASERRMDNDMINEFKVASVGSEKILYKEEIVADSVGTCSAIRSMNDSFDLILVGRQHDENSPIVSELNDWIDYPELGFVGDILASDDFMGKVSTLVIQQQQWAPQDGS